MQMASAPSNSATEHLASGTKEKTPQAGAIRYHSYENEARALRRSEETFSKDDAMKEEQGAHNDWNGAASPALDED